MISNTFYPQAHQNIKTPTRTILWITGWNATANDKSDLKSPIHNVQDRIHVHRGQHEGDTRAVCAIPCDVGGVMIAGDDCGCCFSNEDSLVSSQIRLLHTPGTHCLRLSPTEQSTSSASKNSPYAPGIVPVRLVTHPGNHKLSPGVKWRYRSTLPSVEVTFRLFDFNKVWRSMCRSVLRVMSDKLMGCAWGTKGVAILAEGKIIHKVLPICSLIHQSVAIKLKDSETEKIQHAHH